MLLMHALHIKGDENAVFSNQDQMRYDPYFNPYNKGCRDHPYLRSRLSNNPSGFYQPPCQVSAQDRTNFLSELVIKKKEKED